MVGEEAVGTDTYRLTLLAPDHQRPIHSTIGHLARTGLVGQPWLLR